MSHDLRRALQWADSLSRMPKDEFTKFKDEFIANIGKKCKQTMLIIDWAISHHEGYTNVVYPPHLEALREVSKVNRHETGITHSALLGIHGNQTKNEQWVLNSIYEKLTSPATQKIMDQWRRAESKAFLSHVKQVKEVYQRHHCLTVTHITLTLHSVKPSPTQAGSLPKNRNERFDHFKKEMLKACQKSKHHPLHGLASYHWRVVPNPSGMPCLFMILFFDPSQRLDKDSNAQDAQSIADEIGHFWHDEITNKEGIALTAGEPDHEPADDKKAVLTVAKPYRKVVCRQLGLACRNNKFTMLRLQSLLYTLEALGCLGTYRNAAVKIGEDQSKPRRFRSQGCGMGPNTVRAENRDGVPSCKGNNPRKLTDG